MSFMDTALGVGGLIAGGIRDYWNYQRQEEQFEYEKEAQEKTWDREDSAVSRRVADLKAAGLNPVLAAGSAAQTSSPISVHAPQAQITGPSTAQAMMALSQQKKNIEMTDVQKHLMENQIKESLGRQNLNNWEGIKLNSEINKLNTENYINLYNQQWAEAHGLRSDIAGGAVDAVQQAEWFNKLLGQENGSKTGALLTLLEKLLAGDAPALLKAVK